MKRIELLKKTGICFTAFALSAALGSARPVSMTVYAKESVPAESVDADFSEESIETDSTGAEALGEEASFDAGGFEEESGSEQTSEPMPEPAPELQPEPVAEPEPLEEPDPLAEPEPGPSEPSETEDSFSGDTGDFSQTDGTSGSADTTARESSAGDSGSTVRESSSASSTGGGQVAPENFDDASSSSGKSESSVDAGPAGGSADASSDSGTAGGTVTGVGAEETSGFDTAGQVPDSSITAGTFAPTESARENETTLDPGEVPTGYDQALNYGGTNAQLIAGQHIVPGLSILGDDFRFYTIDRELAFSAGNQEVFEEMDPASRVIGRMQADNALYVLTEERDGWLYIESANVRGFVQSQDVIRGDETELVLHRLRTAAAAAHGTDTMEDPPEEALLQFASEAVPAQDNKAYAYRRCTTRSTLIDKKYAVAETDVPILEETADDAREIGHLSPGNLAYVILQTDKKWVYVESGNVRGFARVSALKTGRAAKKLVEETGEASMGTAEQYVVPGENKALYYTFNSVREAGQYSQTRTDLVELAARCIGNPYVWGGTSLTNGADCSGFVQTLYSMFGYSIPRVADAQSRFGTQIPVSDAAPGDLIFFAANGYVYHVAMYAGDGMTIEAYSDNRGIIATSIGGRDAVWATRIIED